MRLTDEQLKTLYRQQTAHSAQRKTQCPTEELLLRVTNAELSQSEREQVADRLIACSDCADEYRLIRRLKPWAEQVAAASQAEAKVDEKHSDWATSIRSFWNQLVRLHKWRTAAVMAMLVVAIGSSLILWRAAQPGETPVPSQRGGGSMMLQVEPPNRALLPVPPRQLVWSAVEPAESYQVVLYDFESTPIWKSPPVASMSVSLPKTVRDSLLPGQPYYWRVIAMDGIDRRQSRVFQFTLTRDAHR